MRLVIIGGSDAGVSAALRASEMDASASISMLLADSFPNYSICGLPFYLSGETPQWRDLAHRTEFPGIEVLERHEVKKIEPELKLVEVSAGDGTPKSLSYDRLIVATGAHPIRPRIEGVDLPGVLVLHTMEDSFALQTYIEERKPRSVIIVGAGYIGVEMADALTLRGLRVTLISRADPVFPTIDS
jgi:NADPH-dependent 2,4-dienoyl-CoA reductase/sulfur reductase-like enzyme